MARKSKETLMRQYKRSVSKLSLNHDVHKSRVAAFHSRLYGGDSA